MGDGTQQVRAKLLPVRLSQFFLPLGDRKPLLFQGSGRGAGDQGDREHADKIHRISCEGKIDPEIRIGEEIIYSDDTKQCRRYSIEISGCLQRNKDQCKNIDNGNIRRILIAKVKKAKG